jgi:hypothetical protein
MARIFVDEREIPSPPPGISSMDEVLKHIENNYLHPNHVIRQVQVDGLPMLPDGLEERTFDLSEGIEKREKVEVTTGSLREIAHDSVIEAASYLDRIESVIPSLASSFQVYPGPEAFKNLKELYTGFYWLNILLDRLKTAFEIPFSDISLRGVPVHAHHQKFISILQQLVDSQEKGDFVLVADLLEYEILSIIPVWKELFTSIAQRIEATATL